MPPYIRFLINLLIHHPGRVGCLVGLAFSLFLGVNLIYAIRPLAFDRPMLLPACLGIAVIGFGMVMFAAVLQRRPDDSLTARQVVALAALTLLIEALTELSVLLLVGTLLCFFMKDRTAALHLGLGLLATLAAYWGAYRMEKRLENHREVSPAAPGITEGESPSPHHGSD